jgi:hypothetical protein
LADAVHLTKSVTAHHSGAFAGFRRGGALLVLFVAGILPAAGATGGSIAGTITDPSGAAMADVNVVARNTATMVAQKVTTNPAGFYAFPILPSGRYELSVEYPGFKPYLQGALEVTSDSALRADIQLVLGPRDETVTVAESPTRVETDNTQIGDLIGGTKIAGMPVNGRSYTDLLAW